MATPRGPLGGRGPLASDSRWAVDVQWLESSKQALQVSQYWGMEERALRRTKKSADDREGKGRPEASKEAGSADAEDASFSAEEPTAFPHSAPPFWVLFRCC